MGRARGPGTDGERTARGRASRRIAWVALLALLGAGVAPAARAQGPQKTEAEFVSYDAAAGRLEVRITRGGEGDLERGQLVTFAVKPQGSVLDKTAVSSRGARADLSQLSEGQSLELYWQWQPAGGEKVRFAKRIDVAPASE